MNIKEKKIMIDIEKENNELKELLKSFIKILILTIEKQTDPYNFICDCIYGSDKEAWHDGWRFDGIFRPALTAATPESKINTTINIIKNIIKDIEEIKDPLFPNRRLYEASQKLLFYLEDEKK